MKAEKLPSGRWRARAYNRYTGERPSFTAETKKEAERMARQYEFSCKPSSGTMTFGEAYDLYVSAHPQWSPRTLAEYKKWKTERFADFVPLPLSEISDEMLQKWIDGQLASVSVKTAINRLCPVKAVLRRYRPQQAIRVDVGKKTKPKLSVPSEATVSALLAAVEGTEYCVPVYLAAFCAMRRGEIAALRLCAINFKQKVITVSENIVYDENRNWVRKSPKNGEARSVPAPDIVLDKIGQYGLPTITNPDDFSNQFGKFLKRNNLPHFRFHDLRHYCAARMLSLGIPISVVQEYGGWLTKSVLMDIYDYVIAEVRDQSLEKWNQFSSNFPQTTHGLS